jgi:hypothetical protein
MYLRHILFVNQNHHTTLTPPEVFSQPLLNNLTVLPNGLNYFHLQIRKEKSKKSTFETTETTQMEESDSPSSSSLFWYSKWSIKSIGVKQQQMNT